MQIYVPINVKNSPYCAKGDGIADDTKAIQTAINHAGIRGGTAFIPAGKYLVSSPISWVSPKTYLKGDGGVILVASPDFKGNSVIQIGKSSLVESPTLRGGVEEIEVDLSLNSNPDLIGIQLIQAWFTVIRDVQITNPNGLTIPRQIAFQISAGTLVATPTLTTWSGNINVYNLQIGGSFLNCLSHVAGDSKLSLRGMVNAVNYFGGFAFGNAKKGSVGASFECGDTTRVYGLALEDFETGCFVGSQNQGPLDFRFEGCEIDVKVANGLTYKAPALIDKSN